MRLQAECAASLFAFSSGCWCKTAYGTKNLPKTAAGTVIDGWLSVEPVMRVDAWGEALTRPLAHELELMPQANPQRLKPSDKLHLAVSQAGRPATGVTVAYFGQPNGLTDNYGRINTAFRRLGFQLIRASLKTLLDGDLAERRVERAALLPQ